MSDSSSEYASLTSDYTKFMLVRIAIFATVVISIVSGISNLENFPTKNIETIKAIRNLTPYPETNNDNLIELMFFYERFQDSLSFIKTEKDSTIVNDFISKKFPGCSYNGFSNYSDDTTNTIKNYLQNVADSLYNQLKIVSDKEFNIKLSILPDVTFDLRYWVFILPILFAISAIYSYILKFRIKAQQLEDQQNNDGTKNYISRQFPHLYLEKIFETTNYLLVFLFLDNIYTIVEHFPQTALNYLLIFYSITFYFTLVYVGNIYKKILNDNLTEKNLLVNKIWNWVVKTIKKILTITKFKNLFRIGFIFLFLTLFLSMTFQTCVVGNKKPDAIKGYNLIIDYKNSKWQYDDGNDLINRVYQSIYISLVIISSLNAFILLKKIKKSNLPLLYSKFLLIYFSCIFIIFSLYFTFYFDLYPGNLIFFQSLLLIFLWLRNNYKPGFIKPTWNYGKLAETLALYCLPFFLLSVYHLYKTINVVAGWTCLYFSILFFTIGYYLFIKDN